MDWQVRQGGEPGDCAAPLPERFRARTIMADAPDPILIDRLDDPRVAVYRNLKDRDLKARHGRFIAEGEFVVRRLLASPRHGAESVLVSRNKADEIAAAAAPRGVQVFVAPQAVLNEVVGFRFHTGVLACGLRPAPPRLEDVLPADPSAAALLVVCPDLNNSENLGAMIRISAAFGAAALVVGPQCHDPWARQAVRVSMGTIFTLPVVQGDDLIADLRRMGEQFGVARVATVLDAGPQVEVLARSPAARRMAVLFGGEAHGLTPEVLACCDRRVTIPMRLGTDSLNVAVAAGIVLHHYVHAAGEAGFA